MYTMELQSASTSSQLGERMPKSQLMQEPEDRARGTGRDADSLLEAAVRDNFLAALGKVAGLHRIQIRRVFAYNFRVNVYTGPDAASLTITHSHFLSADANGKILGWCPPLAKAE
jgi:hypothetical protein